jgi:D-sedoheptulose 7-phosphate isomerase
VAGLRGVKPTKRWRSSCGDAGPRCFRIEEFEPIGKCGIATLLSGAQKPVTMRPMDSVLAKAVADSCAATQSLLSQAAVFETLAASAVQTLRADGKILSCGNGGSAADALHLAEELTGKYRSRRRSLPGLCLNADPTLLTCIGNDFGFDEVFSRPLEGLGAKGDLLVVFSTSGDSPNILRALETAKRLGVKTAALLGKNGGKAKGRADFEIIVASNDSGRVQEAHTVVMHALLEVIEQEFHA